GQATTVDIPTAVIGGEQRPVLMESPAVTLRIESLPAAVPEAATLTLPIPEQLRGASLRVSALGLQVAVLDQHPRVLPDARAEETISIRLGDVERDPRQAVARSVLVSARRSPAEVRWRSGSLTIPPGARLRFGIGIEDIDWPGGWPAVKFAVVAFDPAAPNQAPEALFEARLAPVADATRHQWFDHEVDLSAKAGRELQLEFSAIPEATGADVPFVFPVWSDPTVVVADHEPRPRPNPVLVSLDTLRADHLGCFGYDRPTSPTIDRFAARSTLFERAYSSFSSTGGSHMTLLTGLYPCVHGIAVDAPTLDRNQSTLAELLRAQGYATGAFTEDGGIVRRLGFGRGFSTYVENLTNKGNGARPPGERTFGDAIAWIEKQ